MKVGFLGPSGSYHEMFARKLYPDDELIPLNSFSQILSAVDSGASDIGILAIENSTDGLIGATIDSLYKYKGKLKVIRSGVLNIEHSIGALPGHAIISRILSKDTALNQCSDYLDSKYPDAKRIAAPSTADAMRVIDSDKIYDAAAIGHADTLRRFKLEVLDENIANNKFNVTRFLVVGKSDSVKGEKNSTFLSISPSNDYPGFLYNVLKILSFDNSINLSSLHSRPSGEGKYWFYIELDGHDSDSNVANALSQLKSLPDTELVIFGSCSVE